MLKKMGSAILSEIFDAAKIKIGALQLVEMPDFFKYRHPNYNFEMGMNRLRYMAPALVAALQSDPKNTQTLLSHTHE